MLSKTIPLYMRVYSSLKNQIESGDYKFGEFLPPEHELNKMFNVSRTTVRKAVEILAHQGFVYVRQGKGTEVLDFKATQKLQYVTSFSETLREQGFAVSYQDVTMDFVSAPRRIAAELKTEPGSQLVKIGRITLANNKPIAVMTNYLLPEMVPDIQDKIAKMTSLYAFLESEYNIVMEAATDYISARAATTVEAEMLEVPVSYPLLVVRRVTHSGGRPVEIAILRIVADRYEYCVHTKDRPPRPAQL